MNDRTAFSIRIPDDLKEWLQDRAKEDDRSVNSYIVQLLRAAKAMQDTRKAA
ncbi:Arc family DNA-binding protein [Allomesorhizobium camelthorni]|uniref:Arc family DNA-binding protein n=1 Tax=Allomesorhizobium camelthorni TaxID=475069 RepID=A0A6G4W4S7_9HYPH|nr:Arc family DNA-binding protein [Mesorhizobium camelthorni]NGO49751.1 Arc family DNA-binding protein [Mesorhizobium camelthorni]